MVHEVNQSTGTIITKLLMVKKNNLIKSDPHCSCLYDMLLGGVTSYKQEHRRSGFNQIDKKNCFNSSKSIL